MTTAKDKPRQSLLVLISVNKVLYLLLLPTCWRGRQVPTGQMLAGAKGFRFTKRPPSMLLLPRRNLVAKAYCILSVLPSCLTHAFKRPVYSPTARTLQRFLLLSPVDLSGMSTAVWDPFAFREPGAQLCCRRSSILNRASPRATPTACGRFTRPTVFRSQPSPCVFPFPCLSAIATSAGGGGNEEEEDDEEHQLQKQPQPPCTGVFASHTDWVTGLAVAEDRIMASASYDGTLKLWDLAATERPSGGMGAAAAAAAAAARMEAGGGGREGARHGGAAAAEEEEEEEEEVAVAGGGERIDGCLLWVAIEWENACAVCVHPSPVLEEMLNAA